MIISHDIQDLELLKELYTLFSINLFSQTSTQLHRVCKQIFTIHIASELEQGRMNEGFQGSKV